jgi:phospholipid N-methyltransferase
MSTADILPFFRAWIRNPLRVAAVAPTGSAASSLMVQEITAKTGPILELGPGTGVFTRALIERGVRQHDLTLVEYGSDFIPLLRHRFPAARVRRMDAASLREERLFEGAPVGAVVSGLGLLTMSQETVRAILDGAFSYLRPGGAFYQITYRPNCPVADATLTDLGLQATCIGQTFRNLPPAWVYRISRLPQRD